MITPKIEKMHQHQRTNSGAHEENGMPSLQTLCVIPKRDEFNHRVISRLGHGEKAVNPYVMSAVLLNGPVLTDRSLGAKFRREQSEQ